MPPPHALEHLSLNIAGETFHIHAVEDATILLDDLTEQEHSDERLPYWAQLWPASIALAEHLLTSAILEPGKKILELGCGSGLAGLAAAKHGNNVTLTDYQQAALDLATQNFLSNNLPAPTVHCMDWRHPNPDLKADILLASDVAYETRFFTPLINTFKTLLNPSGTILLSEPNRELALDFFDLLEQHNFAYSVHHRQAPSGTNTIPIAIYEIYKRP